MTPRPLSLVDAELRSIRTIDDDARRQLDDIADQRDRLLLGLEARRTRVDRLLDERLTIREKAST